MSTEAILVLILGLAVLLAWLRLAVGHRRAPGPRWRMAALVLLQPLCAGLLYLTLVPPEVTVQGGTMTVFTAGAEAAPARPVGATIIALPGAAAPEGTRHVPDLATALRQHPGTTRLQVIGHGLPPRDREAAEGLAIDFEPPPPAAGLAALHLPDRVAPGGAFGVHGRVEGLHGGEVRLLDPAGQVVDAAVIEGAGGFNLRGYARLPGPVLFRLEVIDADGDPVEAVPLPLAIVDPPPMRVMLVAGAPSAEFRHLRRWAEDAGLELDVEVFVGRGVGLGDGPAPAGPEAWGEFDLVILDTRALGALGPARRQALAQAVESGTGVLVRLEGEVPASARALLADLGLALGDDGGTSEVEFPDGEDAGVLRARLGPGTADAPFDAALAGEPPPPLLRQDVQPASSDAVAVAWADRPGPLAWWTPRGRGRIGVWTLLDSHRLVLAGRGDLHGELWAEAAATLARPAGRTAPHIGPKARAGTRMTICGLDADEATVVAPDGSRTSVLVDPAAGPGRCAAYWPGPGGWHLLQSGDGAWPFHVWAADVAPGVAAADLRNATLALAGEGASRGDVGTALPARRGPSWPWFLAWLAASALLWWLERRRRRP